MSKMRRRRGAPEVRRRPTARIERWVIRDHAHLASHPGVRSVSIGLKETGGALTRRWCVKIYVTKKSDTPEGRELPKRTAVLVPIGEGLYKTRTLPTDVVQTLSYKLVAGSGTLFASVPVGAKLGIAKPGGPSFGTVACAVRRRTDGVDVLLTAGHVVTKQTGAIAAGIKVFQPNSSAPNCAIGEVVEGFVGRHPDVLSHLDAALISVGNSRSCTNASWDAVNLPRVRGSMTAAQIRNQRVDCHKVGAHTGHTEAAFSTFHEKYSDPLLGDLFNVIEFVGPPDGVDIASRGDSGAAAVSRSQGSSGKLLGVLFATAKDDQAQRILVVPFESIQAAFGVDVSPIP